MRKRIERLDKSSFIPIDVKLFENRVNDSRSPAEIEADWYGRCVSLWDYANNSLGRRASSLKTLSPERAFQLERAFRRAPLPSETKLFIVQAERTREILRNIKRKLSNSLSPIKRIKVVKRSLQQEWTR